MAAARRQSGTDGLWTFVFIDMIVFGLLFLIFTTERYRLPEIYAASQALLDDHVAFANTLLLVSSSWAMAEAVDAARADRFTACRRWLAAVLGCGLIFCCFKLWEYGAKYQAGIGVTENSFFSFYYFITFLHLGHVVGAMVFIRALHRRLGERDRPAVSLAFVENIGLFWHFVDLLWLFIFPLLYLVDRP